MRLSSTFGKRAFHAERTPSPWEPAGKEEMLVNGAMGL